MRDDREDQADPASADRSTVDDEPYPDAVPLVIDGILDLHAFAPRDVKHVVPVWLEACREAGILDVRIIHGKGIGVLRTIVQAILSEHPAVESFGHPSDGGSWGATVARLRPRD